MKKKAILSVVALVVLAVAIVAVIIIKNAALPNGGMQSFENFEDAVDRAAFKMEYPERLCGYPATDFISNSSTIEVQYGIGGFVRKTLGVNDNSGDSNKYSEINEQSVNEIAVTLKGDDGLIRIATWNDNNFAYTVKLNDGVSTDEMTEYIKATR